MSDLVKVNVSETLADKPLISVAMPVYNGEKYLAEAIDSILSQTFADFEFIIVDDGSRDSSLAILEKYSEIDSRIRLISRENRGFSNTVNEIIALARGTWVARMDQDDIALPHRFATQIEWLNQTNADLCGSWIQYFGAGDRRLWKPFETDEAIKIDMLFKCPIAHPTVMYRAKLIKNLLYDSNWDKAEDYELWVRASMAGWKFTNVQEVLLLYRRHSEQITTKNSIKQKELSLKVQNIYFSFYIENMHIHVSEECPSELIFSYDEYSLCHIWVLEIIDNLARQANGEARGAVYNGAFRICCNIVKRYPSLTYEISKHMRLLGFRFSLKSKLILIIIFIFRLKVDGNFALTVNKFVSSLFNSSRV